MPETTDTLASQPAAENSTTRSEVWRRESASAQLSAVPQFVKEAVQPVLAALAANSEEVIDEGGAPVAGVARRFLADTAAELTHAALLNPNFSIEDFTLTPFARSDGGAELLVDFAGTGKQLALVILPDHGGATIVLDGVSGSYAVYTVNSPDQVRGYLGWLTRRE
ncbi:MAG: hypothetical protein KGJ62_01415 [Armatimonadetes bacterium]|nr:hypothetical protein [Armatimonadota bacterium]MDE2205836.1 hypothetical protein [Armatimonadota bacterium]